MTKITERIKGQIRIIIRENVSPISLETEDENASMCGVQRPEIYLVPQLTNHAVYILPQGRQPNACIVSKEQCTQTSQTQLVSTGKINFKHHS